MNTIPAAPGNTPGPGGLPGWPQGSILLRDGAGDPVLRRRTLSRRPSPHVYSAEHSFCSFRLWYVLRQQKIVHCRQEIVEGHSGVP
jgi:hypothetical protein